MDQSRRVFFGAAAALTAATALRTARLNASLAPQQDGVPGLPQTPRYSDRRTVPFPDTARDPDAELKDNQDHIKKDLARLTQLVGDLQKGLTGSDTTKVLSLDVIHKTEEIEKLARQIRDLIRG